MSGRVLVVDDEPDITLSIVKGLQRNGYDAIGFTDPVEALAQFKPGHYDVILLGIRMPKINGFALSRKLYEIDSKFGILLFYCLRH